MNVELTNNPVLEDYTFMTFNITFERLGNVTWRLKLGTSTK